MIDWMLDSNFPNTPPIAHFLSWTNGNGRGVPPFLTTVHSFMADGIVVNPNLYEEGKVCLSILGTWVGDQSESWSAARSSLLQAFVSIQGLVLVKEPWFCEPAFDKLRGTEEGAINRYELPCLDLPQLPAKTNDQSIVQREGLRPLTRVHPTGP